MDTGLEILLSEIKTFHSVCKSKISFTELYEFIRHIHECLVNFVYLYNSRTKFDNDICSIVDFMRKHKY